MQGHKFVEAIRQRIECLGNVVDTPVRAFIFHRNLAVVQSTLTLKTGIPRTYRNGYFP